MSETRNDPALREIAAVFRCHSTMAVAIADRIRQKLGRAVSNADIARVMKTIPPTRLSVDAVVARLEKQSQRKPRPTQADSAPPTAAVQARQPTLQEQLEKLLADNWRRAKAEKLTPPAMSVSEFVKAVRHYTGAKDAPLRRILKAAIILDDKDVVLTPNVVADQVNELASSPEE